MTPILLRNISSRFRHATVSCKGITAAPVFHLYRQNSSTTTQPSSNPTHSTNPPPSSSSSETQQQSSDSGISWNEYFSLRASQRSRRKWFLVGGVPIGFVGGSAYPMFYYEFEIVEPILGMDPAIAVGLGTVGCGFLGATVAPSLMEAIWRLFNRKTVAKMESKDKDFYQRVIKYRADPEFTNLVPGSGTKSQRNAVANDYYGEKITSKSLYRQWLRRQNELKRQGEFQLQLKRMEKLAKKEQAEFDILAQLKDQSEGAGAEDVKTSVKKA
ncbi:mitochondrial import protein Pam17-domain-containing protein [Paraphysoderma sedebokerense]|nr:mitochondrial import protein Pam17-domain-containing protein [Paraphysoderma sedebokerense]